MIDVRMKRAQERNLAADQKAVKALVEGREHLGRPPG
jgi:hypothetical protein